LLDVNNKKNFLKVLDIPIYESEEIKLFGYKFHDVIMKLTRVSLFIKYGILVEEYIKYNNILFTHIQ